jgi:hypothetical protein
MYIYQDIVIKSYQPCVRFLFCVRTTIRLFPIRLSALGPPPLYDVIGIMVLKQDWPTGYLPPMHCIVVCRRVWYARMERAFSWMKYEWRIDFTEFNGFTCLVLRGVIWHNVALINGYRFIRILGCYYKFSLFSFFFLLISETWRKQHISLQNIVMLFSSCIRFRVCMASDS